VIPRIFLFSRPAVSPNTVIVPAVTGDTQWTIFIVVVLPAPFGPRKAKHSPSSMSNEIPFTATKSSYFLTKSRAIIATGIESLSFTAASEVAESN
jgi:hypothetical protein